MYYLFSPILLGIKKAIKDIFVYKITKHYQPLFTNEAIVGKLVNYFNFNFFF